VPNIYHLVELKDTYDRYVVVRRRVAELRGVKRFRNVLLVAGLDDGPVPKRVLERALGLARRNKAKLALIDVVREFEVVPEVPSHGMLELVLKGRRESLARLAGVAREEGVDIETELAVGQPFLGIIHKVQRSEHDLVITAGGGIEDAGGKIDSTTMHLMRKCPCAIWVVRPQPVNRSALVMAAVDPDPTDPQKDSLNRKIMELAVSVAKLDGSELHVVHVWKLYGLPVGATGEVWKRWEETVGNELKRRLYEFLADYDLGPGPQVHFVAGEPAVAISRLAREKQIDLLVMGTVCRTGVRGFFIGNTAEGVLGRVDCSLLTVKPEGFVSPV